jgi:serine/threonine protein kinase
MGEVYRASHAMLRRPTAVKVLRPEMAGEKNLARFEREVQLTSGLTHPNTIAIFDYGRTPDGLFYYAMEYLKGINLEDLVRKVGPQCPGRTIHILRQVAASLVEAHGVGLIHRDVKPANIILCERGGFFDVVKVVDFGLVKSIDTPEDSSISAANTITGTPHYLSPEAIRTPDKIDGRSDLYAIGGVGYYLLTGARLFDSENFVEICSHQLQTQPEPPSERVERQFPEDLESLIMRCLEKDPDERPANARALVQAFEACTNAGDWSSESASDWWEKHGADLQDPSQPPQVPIEASPTATKASPLNAGDTGALGSS